MPLRLSVVLAAATIGALTCAPRVSDAQSPLNAPGQSASTSPRELPPPLSTRGIENVSAFARALGYVRYFHPSAEAIRTNWDEFAVNGIRRVERAPNDRGSYVVYWQHLGIGSPSGGVTQPNAQNIYRSRRVVVPQTSIGTAVAMPMSRGVTTGAFMPRAQLPLVPDPKQPMHVALSGGVSVTVPLALWVASASMPDSLSQSRPAKAIERLDIRDRATRLADVVLAWSLFEQFYPYFDVVKTDWPMALRTALTSAATDRDEPAFTITLRRLVAALHDGHGSVYVGNRPQAMPSVQLAWAENEVVISAPGDSGMAHGLARGDVLVAIDGRPTATVLAQMSALTSGATTQWVRTRALSTLLMGPNLSTVTVTVRGVDKGQRDIQLVRSSAKQDDEHRVEKISELSPGIMYVDLGHITDGDFKTALPQLLRATGIVFDMRGYPRQVNTAAILSHLTDTVIHSAHFYTPVRTKPDGREIGYLDGAWTLSPVAPRLTARLTFLSGGGAISYAESTLGVVEAYKLGDIIGSASAGTNGNVNGLTLPGGYSVAWTGMRVVKRDGTPHHGIGVLPTVQVVPTIAGIRAGRDEVLERAVEVLRR